MITYKVLTNERFKDAVNLIKEVLDEVNSKDYSPLEIEVMKSYQSEDKLKEKLEQGGIYFIALDGSKLVGIGGLVGREVSRVFVDPSYSGLGIGKELMLMIENEARKRNLKSIFLGSTITAKGFYQKCGFDVTRYEDFVINGMKIKMIMMEKKIA
jgi:putative acetyltransferase